MIKRANFKVGDPVIFHFCQTKGTISKIINYDDYDIIIVKFKYRDPGKYQFNNGINNTFFDIDKKEVRNNKLNKLGIK